MLKLIPDEMIQKRPVLNTGYVWAKLDSGDFDGIEKMLRRSERLYEKMKERQEKKESDMVQVSDYEQFENLPATIASAWAYYYAATGDGKMTGQYAEKALEVHHGTNYHRRGIINIMFGFSLWRSGDLKGAYKKIGEATQDFKRVDEQYSELSVQVVNAEILLELGNLSASEELCKDCLKKTNGHKLLEMLNASFYLILSHLHCIRNDFGAAEGNLKKSREWGEKSALPDWKHNWFIMKSELASENGDYDEALDSLKQAEDIYFPTPMPDMWDIRELKIKNYIRKGDAGSAEILSSSEEEFKIFLKKYSKSIIRKPDNSDYLVEPLTKRELEILLLISQGLTNKEISERLYLALSTVKGYNQNIFSKLHVKSRGMAVNKARELGVL
jgi:LuxR family maltose regulon positive regulatory protein